MTTATVHPTAVVSEQAQLGAGVTIGPYAVIGPNVFIGDGCEIGSHACVDGHTTIGRNCRIGRHACIGADPQDLQYKGEETYCVIGDNNFFGDFSQVTRGTHKSHDRTTHIGNNCFLMAYVHVGHDSVINERAIIANAVQIAGHVVIEDHVHIGGLTALHQFIHVGRYAMVSGGTAAAISVPPFVRVAGYGAHVSGLNKIGLRRSGEFSDEQMKALKYLYDQFFRIGGTTVEIFDDFRAKFPGDPNIAHFMQFVERANTDAHVRGVVRVRRGTKD